MQENTIIPDEEDIYNIEFDNIPSCDVGDYRTLGRDNNYDRAFIDHYRIYPKEDSLIDKDNIILKSGHFKRIVVAVNHRFRPKKGAKIYSWLSYGDYSNNPDFESYWEVEFEDVPLYYGFGELLFRIVDTQDNIKYRLDQMERRKYE